MIHRSKSTSFEYYPELINLEIVSMHENHRESWKLSWNYKHSLFCHLDAPVLLPHVVSRPRNSTILFHPRGRMRREYLGCLHLWLIALRGGKGVENLFQFDLYSNWNRGTVSCLALDKRETRFLYETGLQCNTNIDFILLLCEFLLLLFYYSFNYCLIYKKNISFIYFVSNFFNILIRSLKKKITRYIKRIIK